MGDSASPLHLNGLNTNQLEATSHFEGPLLVLAGAGSGKTRVLTARVCHLIQEFGISPKKILTVTFTNKAAGEMRERITKLLGSEPIGMWMGTFHAMGARLLRRHADRLGWDRSFSIFDSDQSLRLIKSVQEELGLDLKRWNPKAIRAEISNSKNRLEDDKTFQLETQSGSELFIRTVGQVFSAYQEALQAQDAFDFDDLLMKPVELLEGHRDLLEHYRGRFSFILVDEYQDTNRAQFRFVELLARAHGNLMVVGDPDQSIYAWRGADVRNILDFETAFPSTRVVPLEINYRSKESILSAANAVIGENVNRPKKILRASRKGGDKITLVETSNEKDEAQWIVSEIQDQIQSTQGLSICDCAVLYRTNAQARALEDAFLRARMPYQVVGGLRFYQRREIQDVLAYLRLISNPKDKTAFDRIVNYPRRGIGHTTREHLTRWAVDQGVTMLEAAGRAEEVPGIRTAGVRGLKQFADLMRRLSLRATQATIGEILEGLVEDISLIKHLNNEGPDGEDRVRNVIELIAGTLDFDATLAQTIEPDEIDTFTELDLFLQEVALIADLDRLDPGSETVTLMTLHNAKGLEFSLVFIAGLEEGLFPLSRAYDEADALEEERRLFYVGITRAEDKLFMSWARQRRRAGDFTYGSLSSFVSAIPDKLLEYRKSNWLSPGRYSKPIAIQNRGYKISHEQDEAFDMNQDSPGFVLGERVIHQTFGSGAVMEISGFGRDMKVKVKFDDVGEKKLLLRYAGLEKDWP
ncbi:MAG: UvrD-helicase domain-containing protein [Gemmatimonadota bacterium]|uniref:DNA 3'-5' helicase n=1 Tax=marine metagenome TaxID=408172 RepID=A0A381P3N2_9ZZZZ|nr:UvrD-helicase domain-containing protein [Gemmatimonadota bacterium]MEC9317691.1 UvrD-helicase domain-containing protein [Gemmatimonadota bacterium]